VANNFPSLILHIEPTNICNANCVTCPNKSQTRKLGFMGYDLYCRIVDQSQELGIREIRHSLLGEPLLDKSLSRKIAYARSKGIENTVFTNTSLLTKKRVLELIEAGLDNIYASIDTASKEKFENTRKGLDFNTVRDNIIRCVEIRNSLNINKPRLLLNFIVTKDNENEVEPFLHFWEGKVDHINISPAHNFSGEVDVNSSETSIYSRLRSKFYLVPCYYIWNFMFVLWNGDVSACCLDYDGKLIFGNVRESSLKHIWYGEKAWTLRNKHLNGDIEDIFQCQNCSMAKNPSRWL
jgi:radical SAM protein with 4Fe4S-binding SPASM domain